MTTIPSEQKRPPIAWLVSFPSGDAIPKNVGRISLRALCRGNDRIATVLNYFLYEASVYAERNKLPLESCKVVEIKRTLDDILKNLGIKISKKTLIEYLKKLNEWGLVGSTPYHKDYSVNIEAIQAALNNPPVEEKKPRAQKGCKKEGVEKSTTLQPNNVVDEEKVNLLQQKVVELQSNVVELQSKVNLLQPFVVMLQRYNVCEDTLQAALEVFFQSLRLEDVKDSLRLKEDTRESNTPEAPQPASDANASHAPVSLSSQQESVTQVNEDVTQAKVAPAEVDAFMVIAFSPETPDNVALPEDEHECVVENMAEVQPPTNKKPAKDLGPLVMPPDDAPWCAETIVQIHEVRKGRRYPNGAKRKADRERDTALEYATLIVKDMPDITRENYIKAIDQLETRRNRWWLDSGPGHATPKHMYEKDRVHEMLDELKRQKLAPTNGKAPVSRNKAPEYNMDDYHVDESALDHMLESLTQPKGVTANA